VPLFEPNLQTISMGSLVDFRIKSLDASRRHNNEDAARGHRRTTAKSCPVRPPGADPAIGLMSSAA
jgi:hypothetical protein